MTTKWLGGALLVAATTMPAGTTLASSHREAPFIARMPKVDGTDFYMFRSYEAGRAAYVTFVANYQPLQDAYGGPNYFSMDPDAIYEIHVDSDGDSVEDLTFQFDFDLALQGGGIELPVGTGPDQKMVAIPFVNANVAGPITSIAPATQNVLETYKVKVLRGPRRNPTSTDSVTKVAGGDTFEKPLDYIGQKSLGTPNQYNTYAGQFVFDVDIPGCTPPVGEHGRVFVGQRREGFAVNLGQVFDLVNACSEVLDPGSCTGAVFDLTGSPEQGLNVTSGKNVTSIALEVPASCLAAGGDDGVIGGWTTASVRQARVINPAASFETPARDGGPWVQVSRLGLPLINELVIGLPDKDRYNGSEPVNDATNFLDYVTNPTVPEVVELLFGSLGVAAPDNFPRRDLVNSLLVGITGVNVNGATPVPSDMLRLNTSAVLGNPTARANQVYIGAALCVDRQTSNGNTQDGYTIDPSNPDRKSVV